MILKFSISVTLRRQIPDIWSKKNKDGRCSPPRALYHDKIVNYRYIKTKNDNLEETKGGYRLISFHAILTFIRIERRTWKFKRELRRRNIIQFDRHVCFHTHPEVLALGIDHWESWDFHFRHPDLLSFWDYKMADHMEEDDAESVLPGIGDLKSFSQVFIDVTA